VRKLLFHGAAVARGIFKINHEKNHTHFLLIAQEVLQNFLGNPHTQATRTGGVTEVAKIKAVGHAWINAILQVLQKCCRHTGKVAITTGLPKWKCHYSEQRE
jgi:hypothetical protein